MERYEEHPAVVARQAEYTAAQQATGAAEDAFFTTARARIGIPSGRPVMSNRLGPALEAAQEAVNGADGRAKDEALVFLGQLASWETAKTAEGAARVALEGALSSAVTEIFPEFVAAQVSFETARIEKEKALDDLQMAKEEARDADVPALEAALESKARAEGAALGVLRRERRNMETPVAPAGSIARVR